MIHIIFITWLQEPRSPPPFPLQLPLSLSPPSHYVKLWIMFGMRMNPCIHCVCVSYAQLFQHMSGRSGGGGCIYIRACMYASMQGPFPPPPHPPLHHSFLPSLSIYHASIGLSASGMRCGERGRGEGYTGRNRNKFTPLPITTTTHPPPPYLKKCTYISIHWGGSEVRALLLPLHPRRLSPPQPLPCPCRSTPSKKNKTKKKQH